MANRQTCKHNRGCFATARPTANFGIVVETCETLLLLIRRKEIKVLIRKRTRPRRVFAGIVSMVFVLLLAVGQCSAASAEASSDTPVPSKWGYENFRDYMPDLRNQGKYGACWAVSAIALAEINLGRQGKIIKPNLSEVQLAYFL